MGDLLTRNTSLLRTEVATHVAADQVVQGTYWNAKNQRGCFIGCLTHSSDPQIAEDRYGLPIMVQRIAESIFERLPSGEAPAFFAALPDAVQCDGKNLSRVGWQFLTAELRDLPQQPDEIQAAVDPVIAGIELLARGMTWDQAAADAARNAARAAADAAWAARAAADAARAAQAAARNAAWAAEDAADVAGAAADAADAAADAAGAASLDAATRRQRDLLLRLISEAEVHRG